MQATSRPKPVCPSCPLARLCGLTRTWGVCWYGDAAPTPKGFCGGCGPPDSLSSQVERRRVGEGGNPSWCSLWARCPRPSIHPPAHAFIRIHPVPSTNLRRRLLSQASEGHPCRSPQAGSPQRPQGGDRGARDALSTATPAGPLHAPPQATGPRSRTIRTLSPGVRAVPRRQPPCLGTPWPGL